MRIISGTHRSRRLDVPNIESIRPTTDRVKEWIFNVLGGMEGCDVLDLFAGSGNLGLESLSRGAAEATFVDSSHRAVSVIRKNMETLGYANGAEVIRVDSEKFLEDAGDRKWDVIFADPPYEYESIGAVTLKAVSALNDGGRFVLEASSKVPEKVLPAASRTEFFGGTGIYIFGSIE